MSKQEGGTEEKIVADTKKVRIPSDCKCCPGAVLGSVTSASTVPGPVQTKKGTEETGRNR